MHTQPSLATLFYSPSFFRLTWNFRARSSPFDLFRTLSSALVIGAAQGQYRFYNPPECGTAVGLMDELLARLEANTGIDRATAEKSVGIILTFLRKEGPPEKVEALLAAMPGADALIQQHQDSLTGGGIMGAGMAMMGAGLSMGQVQGVTREVINFAREKLGEDGLGEIVGAIPGLSQFV